MVPATAERWLGVACPVDCTPCWRLVAPVCHAPYGFYAFFATAGGVGTLWPCVHVAAERGWLWPPRASQAWRTWARPYCPVTTHCPLLCRHVAACTELGR